MTKYAPRFWNKETKLYQDLIPFDDNNSGTPGLVPTAEKVREISNTVDSHTNNINTLTKNVETNTVSISTLQGNVDTNTKDIGALQTSVNTNKNNIDTLQGKVGDVSVTGLKDQVETNTKNIGALQTQVGDVSVTGLKDQVETNTKNIGALQTQVGDVNVTGLKDQVDTNTTNIGALQTSVNKNTGDISTLKTDVSNNATGINELKTSVQNITNGTTAVGLATQLTTPIVPEGQSSPSHYFLGPDGKPLSATVSGEISMGLTTDLPQSFKGYSFDVFDTIQPTLNNGVIGLTSTSGKIKIPVADTDANTKLPTSGLVQSSDDLTFTDGQGTVANLNLSSVKVNKSEITLQDTFDDTLKKSGDTFTGNLIGEDSNIIFTGNNNGLLWRLDGVDYDLLKTDVVESINSDGTSSQGHIGITLGNNQSILHLLSNDKGIHTNYPVQMHSARFVMHTPTTSVTGVDFGTAGKCIPLDFVRSTSALSVANLDNSENNSNTNLFTLKRSWNSNEDTAEHRGVQVNYAGYYLISAKAYAQNLTQGANATLVLQKWDSGDKKTYTLGSRIETRQPSAANTAFLQLPPALYYLDKGDRVGIRIGTYGNTGIVPIPTSDIEAARNYLEITCYNIG